MADVADSKSKGSAASGECDGSLRSRRTCAVGGPAGSPPAAEATQFGQFAQYVLPTLRRIRAVRRAAEALAAGGETEAAMLGRHALQVVREVDASLRAAGAYELSEVAAMEHDALRLQAACQQVGQVGVRLRALAGELDAALTTCTEEEASVRLAGLLYALNAEPPRAA